MGVYPRLVKANAPTAKKRFGQHFLRDTGALERIVRWIDPAPGDVFLEIGAGDGALSCRLAPKVSRLLAVEIDSDRIESLEHSMLPFSSAVVIPGDVLQMDIGPIVEPHLPPGQKLRVAGNLPYNIATVIIQKLLHSQCPAIQDMSFMVQLEVAQRITAAPGSKQYGLLSVLCQHLADVELGFKVSSACFVPRPQVTSAMVALRPKSTPFDPCYESSFECIAKAAFGYRRKTIANSLVKHPILGPYSSSLLVNAAIAGSRRAEALSISDFERLAWIYHNEFRGKSDFKNQKPEVRIQESELLD